MNSTPFVRQYGILLTNGVLLYAKMSTKKTYRGLQKEVVETLWREKLSHREADRLYGLSNDRSKRWERIYLEEGPEGLYIERRGRKSKEGTKSNYREVWKKTFWRKYSA